MNRHCKLLVCLAVCLGSLTATGTPVKAATATLSFSRLNNSVSLGIYVTMSSGASYWSDVDFHCNKYGGPVIAHIYTLDPDVQGPGTFFMPDPFNFTVSSGDWYAYAVAHG